MLIIEASYYVKTVKCSNCQQELVVHMRVMTGAAMHTPDQMIRCVKCREMFCVGEDILPIIDGPFLPETGPGRE